MCAAGKRFEMMLEVLLVPKNGLKVETDTIQKTPTVLASQPAVKPAAQVAAEPRVSRMRPLQRKRKYRVRS